MRYPLLAVLLVTVCRSSYGQPCKICKPPSADKICTPTEPMTLPAKLVVQSSICNDIETKYKDYQKTLCKTYSGGYYCECTDPQDGNVYSCRSSCGPPLEDIGKGLNLDLLQNNLLSDGNLFANNNKSGGQPNPFDFGKFNGRNPSANFGNFDSLDNLFSNLNPGTPNNRRRRPFSGGGSGSQSKPVSGGSFPSGPRASGQYTPQTGPSSVSLSNTNPDPVSIGDKSQPLPADPNHNIPPVSSSNLDPSSANALQPQSLPASIPKEQTSGTDASGSSGKKNPLDFLDFGNSLLEGAPGVGSGANSNKPRPPGFRNPFDDTVSPFSKRGNQANGNLASQGDNRYKPVYNAPFGGNPGGSFFNYGTNRANNNNNRNNGIFNPSGGFGPSQFDESFGKRNFKPVFNNPSSLGSSGPNPVKTTGS
ncbi:uncharacterized protein DDB_G0283357-like [Pomacea canaliculata]|uniref:uncharacterized protein DDB_G0283357-like n=1 Tax=Pomacea canaliculata TaxID=400727 RepID=UPI000D73BF4E|nr:uncharacterized protein DDB_G0283357-like [Pomacea canaliculata]